MTGLTILDLEAETPKAFTPLPAGHIEGHSRACKRVKIKARPYGGATILMAGGCIVPMKWIEALERNQRLASCCRHPENHELEAFYSSAEDAAKGVPDIYVFHCECGRRHRRFCVGGSYTRVQQPNGTWAPELTHPRIKWEVR